jgi:pimeloyl-ACP methyl ester carboxylesterase
MTSVTRTTENQVAFRTSGEGPTTLVLMHGWAGSGDYFEQLIEHLDPELVYCVSPDLPGHGSSGPAAGRYSLDLIAHGIIAAVDAAQADTFVLLGFSMSAKFAQYVTVRHPDRVLGQILVAGCPTGALPLPGDLIDDWCSRAGDADRLLDVIRSCATQPISAPVLEPVGRDAARVSEKVLRETIALCTGSPFEDEVAGSLVPTLVVGGSDDWLFPPDGLQQGVVDPLARARLEILECGHEIPLEAPRELANLVSQFISQFAVTG